MEVACNIIFQALMGFFLGYFQTRASKAGSLGKHRERRMWNGYWWAAGFVFVLIGPRVLPDPKPRFGLLDNIGTGVFFVGVIIGSGIDRWIDNSKARRAKKEVAPSKRRIVVRSFL